MRRSFSETISIIEGISETVPGNEGRGKGGDSAQIFLLPDVWFKEGRRAKTRVNRVSSAPWSAGVTERIKRIISLLQACFSV